MEGRFRAIFSRDFQVPEMFCVKSVGSLVLWNDRNEQECSVYQLLPTHIQCGTVKEVGTQKTYLSKAKTVICSLLETAMESGDYDKKSDIFNLSYEASRQLFNKCFITLCMRGYHI